MYIPPFLFFLFGIWYKKFFQKRKNHFVEVQEQQSPPTRPESIKWNSLMFSLMLCSVPTPGTEELGFYPIQIEEKRKIIFFNFSQFFFISVLRQRALPPHIQLYPPQII
jgi:hypothetical protein